MCLYIMYTNIYYICVWVHIYYYNTLYANCTDIYMYIGTGKVTERFVNPSAAMRAATLLGLPHEELAKDIFSPPRTATSNRMSTSTLSTSPSVSETSSINMSISSFNISPGTARSYSLDAFVMGLFDHVISCLVLLINR